MANAALSLDKAIRQERVVGSAVGLGGLALFDESILPQVRKDLLYDFGVLRRRGLAENIELYSEPVVDVFVKLVKLGAKRGWVNAFFKRLSLCRSTVLVGAANVEGRSAAGFAESRKHIGRLHKQVRRKLRGWPPSGRSEHTKTLPMMLPRCGTLLT